MIISSAMKAKRVMENSVSRFFMTFAAAMAALLLSCATSAAQQAEGEQPVAAGASTETPAEAAAPAEVAPAAEVVTADGAATGEPSADAAAPQVPAVACTVTRIKGTVEWRPMEQAPWQKVVEGAELINGSDIRTGFRAVCSLVFNEASSVVQLEPLTIMRIGEFEQMADGRVRTRLYLKQGATRSIVEKSRLETDFAIITPEITLAVQGTRVIHTAHRADFGTRIGLSNSGLIHVTNRQTGRARQLRPGDSVTGLMLLAIERAQFSKAVPIFDQFGGVTQNEQYSILRGTQVYTGVGSQAGPGGTFLPGPSEIGRAHV